MNKIMHVSEFLDFSMKFPKTVFYRGENMDYGETACVAKAIRDSLSYDMYSNRIEFFDRKIRESALLDKPDILIPFAQHSGLATKLLDITSNALVALYFACQQAHDTLDGYVYVFDDYADANRIFEKYPRFDLENELLRHVRILEEKQAMLYTSQMPFEQENHDNEQEYNSVEHDELDAFGICIEQYREKYLRGGHSKHSIARSISAEDSPFVDKCKKLESLMRGIKSWAIKYASNIKGIADMLPNNYTENTPAIDFVHPYKEKRYGYYNEQYRSFDLEVKEYLISLECLIAFINDRSPVGNLASMSQLNNLTMDFLPNLLYRPIMTFKRGLSQQSAFFSQTLFDKHELIINDAQTAKSHQALPRQLLKCQANFAQKIVVDGNSKKTILAELDKIGINKATMFGDADSIAIYTMNLSKYMF